MLCYVMLRYVTLCYVMLCYVRLVIIISIIVLVVLVASFMSWLQPKEFRILFKCLVLLSKGVLRSQFISPMIIDSLFCDSSLPNRDSSSLKQLTGSLVVHKSM